MDIKQRIRHVPDFPKPGILFYDITTLLRDPKGYRATIDMLSAPYKGQPIDAVVGIESRGFILGSAVAERIGAGFIPIRKPGKLPSATIKQTYALEYGTDALEIHSDAVEKGQRILIVDDVLATGGTAAAAAHLIRQLGGELLGLAFLLELEFLNGKAKLPGESVFSVLQYLTRLHHFNGRALSNHTGALFWNCKGIGSCRYKIATRVPVAQWIERPPPKRKAVRSSRTGDAS